jgi:HSP20 family molecular chaperone IbpA
VRLANPHAPHASIGPIPVTAHVADARFPMDTVRPWDPDLELFPRDGRMIIRADIPGFLASDVIVELEPGFLIIAGERRSAVRLGDDGEPAFYQVVPLRHGTSAAECAASVRDGVLEVAVPLRADAHVH